MALKQKLRMIIRITLLPAARIFRNQLTFAFAPSLKEIRNISLIDELYRISARDSANYIYTKMNNSVVYRTKEDLWSSVFKLQHIDGLYLEFGVANGKSIRCLDMLIRKKLSLTEVENILIHGFDSFEGLQEDWAGSIGALRGTYTLGGKMPKVPRTVKLYKGYFEKTLPEFLIQYEKSISFIHLDADTYPSTKYVLNQTVSRFKVGTILIFDEYLFYPGWKNGEYKAWQELVHELNIEYTYLGVSETGSVSILISHIK
jgi:hypothetical protein